MAADGTARAGTAADVLAEITRVLADGGAAALGAAVGLLGDAVPSASFVV
ncbi:MAG: hypothetical protein QOF57_1642, partial [Frankiaceae bacterium]|nr:hypothetical protein [Frankiaceae bacterium]